LRRIYLACFVGNRILAIRLVLTSGADLSDAIVSEFPQNLSCGADRNICTRCAAAATRVFADVGND
jgi:hypothetical protein